MRAVWATCRSQKLYPSLNCSLSERAQSNALNFHSLHWLEYSYLQLGRFDDARAKLELMTRYAGESGSARALWYHAAMRAAWIVETGGREAPPEIQPDETQVTGAAADIFASGYALLLVLLQEPWRDNFLGLTIRKWLSAQS